jgi:hypothetical protein
MKMMKLSLMIAMFFGLLSTASIAQSDEWLAESDIATEELVKPVLNDIKIFPNPAQGRFTLSFDLKGSGAFRISMYSLVGNEVFSDTYFRDAGIYSKHFDSAQYEPGIYLMRISCEDETITQKVIIRG